MYACQARAEAQAESARALAEAQAESARVEAQAEAALAEEQAEGRQAKAAANAAAEARSDGEADGEQIVAIDANFGLVRKTSSGVSSAPPLQGTTMFLDDNEVKEFLNKYNDEGKPPEMPDLSSILADKHDVITDEENGEHR
uniref:Uncharacterized protein n=1 Tax=Branchiostoma floridae TaxID=7739 RepID=C3Z164_BRAFL|eukprot:XP_002597751.1 hypothetical protein BRAFLDRAFT_77347 [Branchiostoma floridae]